MQLCSAGGNKFLLLSSSWLSSAQGNCWSTSWTLKTQFVDSGTSFTLNLTWIHYISTLSAASAIGCSFCSSIYAIWFFFESAASAWYSERLPSQFCFLGFFRSACFANFPLSIRMIRPFRLATYGLCCKRAMNSSQTVICTGSPANWVGVMRRFWAWSTIWRRKSK